MQEDRVLLALEWRRRRIEEWLDRGDTQIVRDAPPEKHGRVVLDFCGSVL